MSDSKKSKADNSKNMVENPDIDKDKNEEKEVGIVSDYKIESLNDALNISCSVWNKDRDGMSCFTEGLDKIIEIDDYPGIREDEKKEEYKDKNYKFPFGIWFRGHLDNKWTLEPSVFRTYEYGEKKKAYDESSLIMHFRSKFPHYQEDHKSTFDWLCLMQHYDMPTRLLDWSESILVALYFAVNGHNQGRVIDKNDGDGALYALNARRLNTKSRLHSRDGLICFPDSSDVILRSELAKSCSINDLNRHLKKSGDLQHVRDALYKSDCPVKYCHQDKTASLSCHFKDDYRYNGNEDKVFTGNKSALAAPIAVFPNRINGRMVTQSSTMLIFGGRELRGIEDNGGFEKPKSLSDYHKDIVKANPIDQFLIKFIIPEKKKSIIRKELNSIGINESAIYPETDYQARYIKRQWRLNNGKVVN